MNRWYETLSRFGLPVFYLILFFYLFVLQIKASWPFTIDDMFIPLRYANHWASGVGLVWNPGHAAVEGYSNFSFLLLGRLAIALGIDPVICLKGVGVLGVFASTVGLYHLSRCYVSRRLAFLPVFWLLAYPGEIVWGVSGLETSVYQALIIVSVYCILRGLKSTGSTILWGIAGGCMALASLTRPEAPALMLLFSALLLFMLPSRSFKALWIFVGVFSICFLPYFAWRLGYYGRLFPNPVYCKGWVESSRFLLDWAYLKLIAPLFVFAAIGVVTSTDRQHYFLWLPSVLYVLLYMTADPIVGFYNRFFLPVFALLLPLVLQGLAALIQERWVPWVGVLLMLIAIPMKSLSSYHQFVQNPMMGERLRMMVSHWLLTHTQKNARIVLSDTGLIPFKTNRVFIDSYCLNNLAMGRHPSSSMYETFCRRILDKRPEVIILTAERVNGTVIYTPSDQCLAHRLKNNAQYRWVRRVATASYQYDIFIHVGSWPH